MVPLHFHLEVIMHQFMTNCPSKAFGSSIYHISCVQLLNFHFIPLHCFFNFIVEHFPTSLEYEVTLVFGKAKFVIFFSYFLISIEKICCSGCTPTITTSTGLYTVPIKDPIFFREGMKEIKTGLKRSYRSFHQFGFVVRSSVCKIRILIDAAMLDNIVM